MRRANKLVKYARDTIPVDGILYRCEAKAYSRPLGVGVDVSLWRDQGRVAFVRILCPDPADFEEYEAIVSLSELGRVRLALDRFVDGKLNVTPESLLESQRKLAAVSGSGVVAIIASFQQARPNHALHPIAREDARSD